MQKAKPSGLAFFMTLYLLIPFFKLGKGRALWGGGRKEQGGVYSTASTRHGRRPFVCIRTINQKQMQMSNLMRRLFQYENYDRIALSKSNSHARKCIRFQLRYTLSIFVPQKRKPPQLEWLSHLFGSCSGVTSGLFHL